MKRNSFYLLLGIIVIIETLILAWSLENHIAPILEISLLIGIITAYIARKQVTDIIDDERSAKITEKAAVKTFQIFWVVFFIFSMGALMNIIGPPPTPPSVRFPHPPPPPIFPFPTPDLIPPWRTFGFIQLILLAMLIFLYAGFRIYYARKFGEWDTDEEQD